MKKRWKNNETPEFTIIDYNIDGYPVLFARSLGNTSTEKSIEVIHRVCCDKDLYQVFKYRLKYYTKKKTLYICVERISKLETMGLMKVHEQIYFNLQSNPMIDERIFDTCIRSGLYKSIRAYITHEIPTIQRIFGIYDVEYVFG